MKGRKQDGGHEVGERGRDKREGRGGSKGRRQWEVEGNQREIGGW